jgi:hypothetical protein
VIAMDLCFARASDCTLALSVSQVAGVAPFPASLPWPTPADGSLGWVAPTGGDSGQSGDRTGIHVVDPVTYWRMTGLTSEALERRRERPSFVVVIQGRALALAVDAYSFGSRAVYPVSPVLQKRGIYALAPIGGDYAIVFDMACIAPTQQVGAGAPAR